MEPAGNDCIAKPNSAPPQGSHWYYRVDRAANRRCWFLGPQGLKVRQAESPKRLISATSTPQLNSDTRAEAAASESVANVSTSPSLSKGEPPSTNDDAGEHTTADNMSLNFGATAGVSANVAAAEQPPEVTLGMRATAAAPAEDASIFGLAGANACDGRGRARAHQRRPAYHVQALRELRNSEACGEV